MNPLEFTRATTQSYASLPRELSIAGRLLTTRSLAFNMEPQTQSNWCWAATSTSVSHFYWSSSSWAQCSVACEELNRTDCCTSPVPSSCNVPWYLDRALARTRNFLTITGPINFAQVRAEIDAGRVVGTRIGWNGGGGHFMVIYGYAISGGVQYFDIDDPIYGKSHLTVTEFSSNYQGSGTWTHAYLTQSYTPRMHIKPLLLKDEILRKIWDERPLLAVKAGLFSDAPVTPQATALGLAHRIFSLGAHEVAEGKAKPHETGVRVIELDQDKPSAFFDIADTEIPNIRQMSASSPYLALFPRALEHALLLASPAEPHEARLLRIPALNFEALWLHGDNEAADQVIPLRSFHGFSEFEAVPYQEAMERLRGPARSAANQVDTTGA